MKSGVCAGGALRVCVVHGFFAFLGFWCAEKGIVFLGCDGVLIGYVVRKGGAG